MHFVKYRLYSGGDRAISDTLDQLSHIVDAGPAGGIHLNDVDTTVLANGDAAVADTAGIDCRPAVAVRSIQFSARDNTRRGRSLTPRTPVSMNACATRPVSTAFEGADKRVLSIN